MSAFDDALWTRLVDQHEADRVAIRPVRKQNSRRPLWVGFGGVAAVSVAGVLAAVLSLAGAAGSAFAGWTPEPTLATAAQLAAANAYCAKNVPTPGLPLRLTDTRGPFTFEIFANETWHNFCITGPSFANASGWGTSTPVRVPAGSLYLSAEHTTVHAGQAYGFVIARAGVSVTAATLTLEDGTQVTATVQNGWAVAWWPGSHQVTLAQLRTASGTQPQTFPVSRCGLHNCNGGGPHGGAPGGGPGGG
jgi:hypothetical protein